MLCPQCVGQHCVVAVFVLVTVGVVAMIVAVVAHLQKVIEMGTERRTRVREGERKRDRGNKRETSERVRTARGRV